MRSERLAGHSLGTSTMNSTAKLGIATAVAIGTLLLSARVFDFAVRPALPVTPESGVKVVGRFLLPDGRAAAGARWTLAVESASEGRRMEYGAPERRTQHGGELDADGRLEVVLDPLRVHDAFLHVSLSGYVSAFWSWERVGLDETKDIGTYTLRPVGRVTGRVVDESGVPLTGRSLRVHASEGSGWDVNGALSGILETSGSTTVDPETARFEIDGLPAGVVILRVQNNFLGSLQGPTVPVVAGETFDVDVVLRRAHEGDSSIRVRTDTSPYYAVPPPGAEHVSLIAPDGTRRRLDAMLGGPRSFTFDNVGRGTHRIVIDDPRFETWRDDEVFAGDVTSAKVRGNATLALDVRDAEGVSVELYSVEVEFLGVDFAPHRFWPHHGKEPLEGGLVRGLVAGDFLVTVHGIAGAASAIVADLAAAETRGMSLVFGKPATVKGRVSRPDGAPAAGVAVRLVTPAERDDSPSSVIRSTTVTGTHRERFRTEVALGSSDADGRFQLNVLIGGRYLIYVGEPAGPHAETGVITFVQGEDVQGIELALSRRARIEGRIQADAGRDLASWRVLVDQPQASFREPGGIQTSRVEADGSFDTGPVAAGRVRLFLYQPGSMVSFDRSGSPLGLQLLDDLVVSDGLQLERTYPFPAADASEVTFKIDVAGVAPGRCDVVLYAVGEEHPTLMVRGAPENVGSYSVPPGRYDVVLSSELWCHEHPDTVTIEAGEVQVVHVTVPLVAHRVQVMKGTEPLAERRVFVIAQNRDLQVGFTARTDDEGFLNLRLGRGGYELFVSGSQMPAEDGGTDFRWPLVDGVTQITIE